MTITSKQRLQCSLLVSALWVSQAAFSQTASVPFHFETYGEIPTLSSPQLLSQSLSVPQTETVSASGAPWLQLDLSDTVLEEGSYLLLKSAKDGARQTITAEQLKTHAHSAYFNGDSVEITLHRALGDTTSAVSVPRIKVGEMVSGVASICGVDNRVASTEKRVARIDPVGCTGWIASNGKLLTAGHCVGTRAQTLSFNPPASLANGTVQFPGPEDQYTIDRNSFVSANTGIGNDWSTFTVANNSTTGQQPFDAQGGGYDLSQSQSARTIRITGFGVDDGTTNQTNQTHAGASVAPSGNRLRYTADTTGGNSGSPVVDDDTGVAIGIHTNGGCSASGGSNSGTSFTNSQLWDAVDFDGSTNPDPDPASCSLTESFEGGNGGWTTSGDCTTGTFTVGTPDRVTNSGVVTQVGGAQSGSNALFTQPNSGGAGTDDVDGGECIATSPVYDIDDASTVSLYYFHGQRDQGDDATDGFDLDVSINGSSFSSLVSIGDVTSDAAWTNERFTANAGDRIQLRVRTRDGSSAGDLVEAGIDNLQICDQVQ